MHTRNHILFQIILLRCHLNYLLMILLKPLSLSTLTLAQKDNIDIILDEQVIFTKDGKVQ